jgi:hypothetical protein
MFDQMSDPVFRFCFVSRTGIYQQTAMCNHTGNGMVDEPDTVVELMKEEFHNLFLPEQM